MGAEHIFFRDHSAATFVKPDGVNALISNFTEHFGNPSSICSIARESKNMMDVAQVQTAEGSCGEP